MAVEAAVAVDGGTVTGGGGGMLSWTTRGAAGTAAGAPAALEDLEDDGADVGLAVLFVDSRGTAWKSTTSSSSSSRDRTIAAGRGPAALDALALDGG